MAGPKLTFILLYLTTISFLFINKGCASDLVNNNKDLVENIKDIPKIEHSSNVGNENLDITLDKDITTSSAVSLEHEVYLGDEVSQGSPGEHFIALPAHNLGAVENLDPSLKGLSGIVTSKLPSNIRLIRIVDATREVVAGFRYDFTLEVVNTEINSEPYICVFALIERPWIITEWGSKERSIILNNCTTDDKSVEEKPIIGTNINPSLAEKLSEISDNTENNELTAPLNNIDKIETSTESTKVDNYESVAEFGHIEEVADAMSPERLKDMEEQIIAKAEPHHLETVTVFLKEEPKLVGIKFNNEDNSSTQSTYDTESVTDIIKEDDKKVAINIEEQETDPTKAPYNIETATEILKDYAILESSAIGESNLKVEPCNIETVTATVEIYESIKLDEGAKTDDEKVVLKKDALDGMKNWLDNVRVLDKSPKHQTIDKIEYKSLQIDPQKPVTGETLDALKGWLDDVRIKNKQEEAAPTGNPEENINIEKTTAQAVDTDKLNAFEGLLDLLQEPKVTKTEQTYTETEQDQRVPVEETFVAQKAFTLGTGDSNADVSSKSSESSEESTENKITSEESSEEDIVTSYVTRRKRNTNRNLLMKLANNAVNALDHIDSDNRKRVVLEILDSKQKIKSDGTYFTIKVRIATTDCSETVDNIGKCTKMIIKDTTKICNIEVKKNGDEERVIKSQCSPVKKLNRSKRDRLVGGTTPADPNDSYVQELLADIKGSLESYHGLENPLNVKLNSVTKQVVAGSLYKYEIEIDNNEFEKQVCTVSVWDRPWLPDGREITAECGSPNSNAQRNKIEFKKKLAKRHSVNDSQETNKPIRTKRSKLKGGVSPADPNDSYVQELLSDIKGSLQSYHGLENPLNVKLISVTKQVVAGSLYKYEIEIDNNEFEKQACRVSVWDRPWLPDGREITAECGTPNSSAPRNKIEFKKKSTEKRSVNYFEVTGKSIRTKRNGLPGGVSPADPNDPYVQELLADIKGNLETYHGLQHSLNIKLNSVTKQVVAGSLYKYEIEIDNNEFEKQVCTVSVWDRPWLPDGREIKAECGSSNSNAPRSKIEFKKKSVKKRSVHHFEKSNDSLRVKRHTLGGTSPADPNDPYVQEILSDIKGSLQSYHGLQQPLNIKLNSVTQQVVAGSLYKYEIEIDNDDFEKQTCTVSVWDRPWLPDGREITAECYSPNTNEKVKKITLKKKSVTRRSADIKKNLSRRKRQALIGGASPADPNDSYVREMLSDVKEKLQSYNGLQNELNIKLLSVTQQVVAGTLYKYEIEVENEEFDKQTCSVSVWDRPWIKDDGNREISAECGDPNSNVRNKIQLKKSQKKRSMYEFENNHFELLRTMNEEDLMKLSLFDSFIKKYEKIYLRNEFLFRFNVFKQNLERINKLNRNERGTATYGITEFADLTRKEFKIHTGLAPREQETNDIPRPLAELFDNDPLPESFDWREKGAVSPVKDQGSCGSCWAFSVTGNIEGLNAIKTGKLEEFSEQELLDCDSIDEACNGGLPDNAYKAIEQIGGLESESDYPYEARKEKTCHFNSTLSKVKVKGAIDLPKNETKMAQFLVLNGPISIGINANAMQFYRGGVSHPWKVLCNPTSLDHGVLIVGYGTHSYPKFKKELPYWIIKNSWGPSWGEQGYYRVYRGDGTCGVNQMASSAIIE